jgi:hypothetical protein
MMNETTWHNPADHVAPCDAIAEAYSAKAHRLRLLLNEPSGVS